MQPLLPDQAQTPGTSTPSDLLTVQGCTALVIVSPLRGPNADQDLGPIVRAPIHNQAPPSLQGAPVSAIELGSRFTF